jgi:hypothetical protein
VRVLRKDLAITVEFVDAPAGEPFELNGRLYVKLSSPVRLCDGQVYNVFDLQYATLEWAANDQQVIERPDVCVMAQGFKGVDDD